MKKTGVKTFLYSFIVSLFVIFGANGFFVRENKASEKRAYTPGKNISLFFKNAPENIRAQTIPIKKIALSVPEETPVKTSQNTDEIPIEIGSADDEIQIASVEDMFANQEAPTEPESVVAHADDEAMHAQNQETTSQSEEKILALLEKPEKKKPATESLRHNEDEPLIPLERKEDEISKKGIIKEADEGDKAQVAMNESDAPLKEMARNGMDFSDSEFEPVEKAEEWKTMQEINPEAESPWVVAKGAKHPKNNLILEQDFAKAPEDEPLLVAKGVQSQEEILASAEIVKNILIPIPEEIMSQEELTPRLVVEDDEEPQEIVKAEAPPDKSDKKGLFDSIKSKISGISSGIAADVKAHKEEFFSEQDHKSNTKTKRIKRILPTEMKLSFQPNRAEISGQTLKWVHAFVNKAKEEGIMLEIRINSEGSPELQSRRLNLLHSIIDGHKLGRHKVNTIATDREPNSFVIRTVRMVEDKNKLLERKTKEREMLPYYHHAGSRVPQNFQ
ncbi:MAG: hypothetical protein LBL47_04160, partial [Lactobacillus sp.]|nr:hypothetical protein [Lactobacillus sp.]